MKIEQSTSIAPEFVVDVRGMTKVFGNKTVVDAIDMQIRKGSVFGFLGPNGSGKTTFIRMLCGLLEPTHGSGVCLGLDVLRDQRRIKRKVGYMTQKFSYYEDLSVRENLDFVAQIYGLKNRRSVVDHALERLGLSGRGSQLAGKLSGGWKQRLALAASMLHEPQLLLLDEPTAGVDPQARRDFWEQIHGLAETGLTVMVTTHYMDEAERCHELAYIAYGKLLAHGTMEELIHNSGLHTFEVTGRAMHELLRRLEQCDGVDQCGMFGTALHASGKEPERVESCLRSVCGVAQSFRKVETSLEDVFIHLMRGSRDNYQANPGARS